MPFVANFNLGKVANRCAGSGLSGLRVGIQDIWLEELRVCKTAIWEVSVPSESADSARVVGKPYLTGLRKDCSVNRPQSPGTLQNLRQPLGDLGWVEALD